MQKRKKKVIFPRVNKKKLYQRAKHVSLSGLHAAFMIFFLFLWLLFDVSLSIESTFIKWQSSVKNLTVLRNFYHPEYTFEDAVFIDVSASKVVAFDSINLKKVVITDRAIIDTLLSLLASRVQYKFILCDLFFDIPSDYDSLLNATIHKTKRIGFPPEATTVAGDPLLINHLPGGSVGYSYTGNFYKLADEMVKFRLVKGDSEKSLPLFMAETVMNMKLVRSGNFLRFSNKKSWYLNNLTIDDHINKPNLMRSQNVSAAFMPEDIINQFRYQDSATREILNNKIIIIGDLSADIHKTAFGEMPGSLIMYNIFLSLMNGENTVTLPWVLFLFIMFTLLSYFIFYGHQTKLQKAIDFLQRILTKFFLGDVSSQVLINMFFLFIISLLSYFIFQKNIELIALSLWLTVLEYTINRIKAKEEWFKVRSYDAKNVFKFLLNIDKPQTT